MELQARTQETKGHCAKGRKGGGKASQTPKLPYQWTWELGGKKQQTGYMQCSNWRGRETAWCFGMAGVEQGHTAIAPTLRTS